MATSSSAPVSAAGFGYQLERGLWRLATCSEHDIVGIEADDDVAVRDPSGLSLMEQDKLSFQDVGHPFQDSSRGLWRTLEIWVEAYRDGSASHRTAPLHLVTNRPVPKTALVWRISHANDDTSIKKCILQLNTIAKGCTSKLAQRMNNVVSHREALRSVIERAALFDGNSNTEGQGLRRETISRLMLPPGVDGNLVAQALLGWMSDLLMACWRNKQAGWISREAMLRQLYALLKNWERHRQRERAARLVPVTDEDRESARGRPFIERMLDVEVGESDLSHAIESFIRFSSERIRLDAEGEIVQADWESFFDRLSERWGSIHRRNSRNRREMTDVEVGQATLFQTTDDDYCAPLAGSPTQFSYFTCGGYHRLADVDHVWWHPEGCLAPSGGEGQS